MATLAAVPASDSGLAMATEFSTCGICENTHSPQSKEACTLQSCEHSFHKACLAEIQTMAVSESVCPVCSLDDPLVQVCFCAKLQLLLHRFGIVCDNNSAKSIETTEAAQSVCTLKTYLHYISLGNFNFLCV